METRVTDREVTEHLDELIDRVNRTGETLVVERNGKPVLRIDPAQPTVATGQDLRRLFELFPPPDEEFIRHVNEARGAQEVEVTKLPLD